MIAHRRSFSGYGGQMERPGPNVLQDYSSRDSNQSVESLNGMPWEESSTSFSSLGSCGTISPHSSMNSQEFDNNEIPTGAFQVRQRRVGVVSPGFDLNYRGSEFNEALMDTTPNLLNLQNNTVFYCSYHNTHDYYCQTCSKTFCFNCEIHCHATHNAMQVMSAFEKATTQSYKTIKQAKEGINILNEDIKANDHAKEVLHQNAMTAQIEVISSIERLKESLDERLKQLIEEIKLVEQQKLNAIEKREYELTTNCDELQMIVNNLCHLNDSPIKNTVDTMKYLIAEDISTAEVLQMSENRKNLIAGNDEYLLFVASETEFYQSIDNFGSVKTNNPGPIGDKRALRGRASSLSPQLAVNSCFSLMKRQLAEQKRVLWQQFEQLKTLVFEEKIRRDQLLQQQQYFQQHRQYRQHHQRQQSHQQHEQKKRLISPPPGRPIPGCPFTVGVKTQRMIANDVLSFGNCNDELTDSLCRPWGVCCDRNGNIFVADRSNNRIQVYSDKLKLVCSFGKLGTAPGQFDRPAGVVVDNKERLIIADKDNHRIQITSLNGHVLKVFGEKGSKNGQFNYPWDVAANEACDIIVSDTRNHRIQLFNKDGQFMAKYDLETQPSFKYFDSPRGVAFRPNGDIVVTDFNNHCIVVVDYACTKATPLISTLQKDFLNRPQGVIVDDDGNIIVSDSRHNRIQILDESGQIKRTIVPEKIEGMENPSGIALTPQGKIVVVDFAHNRVLLI